MAKDCEHTRQIMSVGYARCLDCGAETTLTRIRPTEDDAPDPATPVLLTATQRDLLALWVSDELADDRLTDAERTELEALSALLEG